MWPWGHLAVGYLVYTFISRISNQRAPRKYPVLALALGTQFPDLIDKPLAWTVEILPHGRSLAHSLLTTVVLIVVLRALVRQRHRRPLVVAFSIGYLTHLATDAVHPLVAGEYTEVSFLVWPLIPATGYTTDQSFIAHFQAIEFTPFFLVQLGLVVLAVGVWLNDGTPGLDVLKRVPTMVCRRFAVNR